MASSGESVRAKIATEKSAQQVCNLIFDFPLFPFRNPPIPNRKFELGPPGFEPGTKGL
jgi:hypothetical protein